MLPTPSLVAGRARRRAPRRGGGGRGPADAGPGPSVGDDDVDQARARDQIIRQTDGDASGSRMSAVSLRYLHDPYAKALFHGGHVPQRYPIINRGTYVRTAAIDKLVTRFLEAEPHRRKQVVSLGAGSDTRFFRLCAGKHHVVYHEMDFEQNVGAKRAAIRASEELTRQAVARDAGAAYHLHAIDLRVLAHTSPPPLPALEPDLPTLILSECCLCYLPPDAAAGVLDYFTARAGDGLGVVLYEPIRPFDAFGKTMVANLASRGIELRTLKRYSSLEAQRQRLRLAGFVDGQGARDVHQLFEHGDWVSEDERERIERLEWLDEVEEWQLLARHYCVAWGWRGQAFATPWAAIDGSATADERRDEDLAA